jgi:hypothetical protein
MNAVTNGGRPHTRRRAVRVTIAALTAMFATALAADAHGGPKADLIERSLGNPPAQLSAPASFMVRDVVANRGAAGAGPSLTATTS